MIETDTGVNSNDGESALLATAPYRLNFTIRGVADLLFHRWSSEDVAAKQAAKRGSSVKKTDNLEAYIWRDEDGMVCLPGTYLHKAIIEAGKFMQDPRSSRAKQACDLFKAAFIPVTTLCPLGPKWEIEDKRRMVVNRAGITRTSPGFKSGWEAAFDFDVILPEYVSQEIVPRCAVARRARDRPRAVPPDLRALPGGRIQDGMMPPCHRRRPKKSLRCTP